MKKAVKIEETLKELEMRLPKIRPEDVQIEMAYHSFKLLKARLPKDLTFQDLHDHTWLWGRVQKNIHTSICRGDQLIIVDYLENEYATAVCSSASKKAVELCFFKKTNYQPHTDDVMWSCESHYVRWNGKGYAVYNYRDHVQEGQFAHDTVEAAKHAAFLLLPKKAVN